MSCQSINISHLLKNPAPRLAISLILDHSGSMTSPRIKELNTGIQLLYDLLRKDRTASASAEISIITFDSKVELIQDFQSLNSYSTTPKITGTNGTTTLGTAVNLALNTLEFRMQCYKKTGVDYYQPLLVLMTDGKPYGEPQHVTLQAANRCRNMEKNGNLNVHMIGIGPNANMQWLQKFTTGKPMRLNDLRIAEFFKWFSDSIIQVSHSSPRDYFLIDWNGKNNWRQI